MDVEKTIDELAEQLKLERDPPLNYEGVELQGFDFTGAQLRGANFSGAKLKGAVFMRATLEGADFSQADLQGADFRGADIGGALFAQSNLRAANLRHAACMLGANLKETYFRFATLKKTDLTAADMAGANLTDAEVVDVLLGKVDLSGIRADAAVKCRLAYFKVCGICKMIYNKIMKGGKSA